MDVLTASLWRGDQYLSSFYICWCMCRLRVWRRRRKTLPRMSLLASLAGVYFELVDRAIIYSSIV